jgi:predicted site-specific integrase-resolvase
MLLTIQDVMEQLMVSRATVLGWIEAGLLEAMNVAPAKSRRKFYRISPNALTRFLQSRSKADIMSIVPVSPNYLKRE